MNRKRLIVLVATIAAIAALSLSVGYILAIRQNIAPPKTETKSTTAQTSATPTNQDNPFLSNIFSADESTPNQTWQQNALQILVRLTLAVMLSAILAFRPRKNIPLFQRNLYVAQTQILLAVVAAALMMIVGDNTARAFAIFAAVSLVRFRTNIRDPKEITVLLISLALGLASGVGRWELGLMLCLFVLVLLWLLEYREPEQIFRSMELMVKTKNTEATQQILKQIFKNYDLEAEVRELDPSDENEPIGSIVYYLNLRLNISTDRLSDRIFASDSNNIEGIQWKQQKSVSYIQ